MSQSSYEKELAKAAREAERREKARLREQEKRAKENERHHVESQIKEVERQNEKLDVFVEQLNSILADTVDVDDYFDLDSLMVTPNVPEFIMPRMLSTLEAKPDISRYLPDEPKGVKRLLPGAKKKYDLACAEARKRFETDLEQYQKKLSERQKEIDEARADYEQLKAGTLARVEAHNNEIEELKEAFGAAKPGAIVKYFAYVLASSTYPEGFSHDAKLAYVPESKQLVVEFDLPDFSIIPEIGAYKYLKAKDEIAISPRSSTQRKALYASVIAQVTIRTIHELFEADRTNHVDTVVFNGFVEAIDKATGRNVRACVVTVRTTRDTFEGLDLRRLDPAACLKFLSASFSKSPDELAPVRPVIEFDMVDPRFIEETDVISTLDQRPNLMDLSPSEFESLITNLFEKMGLETRLTQAARDGGVDCVAYDPRPIFGGKVVIQAKRYKNTVGVSAVRDLYGTLQNEGASKGILVTTSGYGKAAYEFAEGKPIELLSGSNLLYLLSEHAGIEAKIVVPDDWKDPRMDVESI